MFRSFRKALSLGTAALVASTAFVAIGAGTSSASQYECWPDWPDAVDDTYTAWKNTTLTIDAPGVLANDCPQSGVRSGNVQVIQMDWAYGAGGVVNEFSTDGSFTFTPDPGFVGTATFHYVIRDEGGTDKAFVHVNVYDPSIFGNDPYKWVEPDEDDDDPFKDEERIETPPARRQRQPEDQHEDQDRPDEDTLDDNQDQSESPDQRNDTGESSDEDPDQADDRDRSIDEDPSEAEESDDERENEPETAAPSRREAPTYTG